MVPLGKKSLFQVFSSFSSFILKQATSINSAGVLQKRLGKKALKVLKLDFYINELTMTSHNEGN